MPPADSRAGWLYYAPGMISAGLSGALRPSLALLALSLAGASGTACTGPTTAVTGTTPTSSRSPTTRTYYIAAKEVDWDYAPTGENRIKGQPFDDDARVFVEPSATRIGRVYRKAIYREYTDDSFTTEKQRTADDQHLGILGPTLRGAVGDTLRVVFRNNTKKPASVHPHGVFYDKASEGALYNDGSSADDKRDDMVAPGATYTYEWQIPERAGPGPDDPSSVVWLYHSHVVSPEATNAGLIGTIVVTRADKADANGRPTDVDREFVTLFTVFDENASAYASENLARLKGPVDAEDEGLVESNLMHAINGYVYGNQPGLLMQKGERVRWYLVAMGTEVDLHTPHWHGQTVLENGRRTDVVELMPASMKVADMVADSPGIWLYHCHVNDHITAGMLSLYAVGPLDRATLDKLPTADGVR